MTSKPTLKHPPIPTEDLIRIAQQTGTPCYVYAVPRIQQQVNALKATLEGLPYKLLYAIKANYHPAILQLLHQEGIGFDAVSPTELLLTQHIGASAEQVLFSPNFMTDQEMHLAHRTGVLLNIGELSRLERYGQAYPGSEVCVRLNPQVGAGHHKHVITAGTEAKFGIPLSQLPDLLQLARRYNLRIIGLHQHIGSGFMTVDAFIQAVKQLLNQADRFPDLTFLNFGGGLGIPYHPSEAPFPLEELRQRLHPLLQGFLAEQKRPLTFWFEPGRFFVAESGILLVQVTALKKTEQYLFAGTDSGFNHLIRPVLYQAYHAVFNLSNPTGRLRTYHLVGNVCESGDILAPNRPIQEIREGDYLAILDTGAYGMSMASLYNLRPLPAEVLYYTPAHQVLIRPHQTPEDLAQEIMRLLPNSSPHTHQAQL